MGHFRIKRVYDPPANDDGCRVLVDRLWPRGLAKEDAALDLWLKEVAPSPDLRKAFDHKPERFERFTVDYEQELDGNDAVQQLVELGDSQETVTLLYAAKDQQINHAVVLLNYLTGSD
jgi:uncharacterized protein YeaO (DUF488 family)